MVERDLWLSVLLVTWDGMSICKRKPTTANVYARACVVRVCAYGVYVCETARVDVFVEFRHQVGKGITVRRVKQTALQRRSGIRGVTRS